MRRFLFVLPLLFLAQPSSAATLREIVWRCNSPTLNDAHIRACTILVDMINLDRNNQAAAFVQRAKGYLARGAKGDLEAVIFDTTHALVFNPDNAEAYYLLGEAHKKQGLTEQAATEEAKAIEVASKIVEMKPAAGYSERALLHHLMGEDDKALPDAIKLVELKPESSDALALRGEIQEKLGHRDEAATDFRAALKLSGPKIRVGGEYDDWSTPRAMEGLARLGETP